MSNKVEQAKKILKDAGYFVDNLWHIEDVTLKYNCDPDTAQGILGKALTNDATMEQIHMSIDIFADMEGLEKNQEEE